MTSMAHVDVCLTRELTESIREANLGKVRVHER